MFAYEIKLNDGRSYSCTVDPERTHEDTVPPDAPWCQLTTNKCSQCPLSSETWKSCPLATDIHTLSQAFENLPEPGTDQNVVEVVVKTASRWYFKALPIEDALKPLWHHVALSSGCPILRGHSWQRKFFIPFTDTREQAFLEFAHHILAYMDNEGATDDRQKIAALRSQCRQKNEIHADFILRLQEAGTTDSNLNSLVKHLELAFSESEDTFNLTVEVGDLIRKTS